MRGHFRALSTVLLVFCLALVLAACDSSSSSSGSNSSSSDSSNSGDNHGGDVSTTISGIAAAGAPVQGFVYARDKNGIWISCPIEIDGSYSLDVSGLSAPFIIYASGMAGGRSVELYSYLDALSSDNNTNITPATNFAVAAALGTDPAQARAARALDIPENMEEKAEQALDVLEEKLSVVLQDQGAAGIDLRSGTFSANGSGLDAVFDVVDFTVSSNGEATTIGLLDKASGTLLLKQDAATGVIDEDLDTMEIANKVNAGISEKQAIEAAFQRFLTAADEKNETAMLAELTVDFLAGGNGPDDYVDGHMNDEDFLGGTVVSVSIVRPMGTYTFSDSIPSLQEHKGYSKGYWVYATIRTQDQLMSGLLAYVQDDSGNWLWHGDRAPGESPAYARREMLVEDDKRTYRTGLDLYTENDSGEDLPLIVVMGPGIDFAPFQEKETGNNTAHVDSLVGSLPETITFNGQSVTTGLTQYAVDTDYKRYAAYNAPPQSMSLVTEDDGLKISEIKDNSEYRFIAFNASGTPKYAWTSMCAKKPMAKGDLTPDDFPRLLTVDGATPDHDINSLSRPDLAVTWEVPEGTYPDEAEYGQYYSSSNWGIWGEEIDNPAWSDPTQNLHDWTSFTVDNADPAVSPFGLMLRATDRFDTIIKTFCVWE